MQDLTRLRDFLREKNHAAAKRAGEVIVSSVRVLARQPLIGRPVKDMPQEFRELTISFGKTGYIARYRYAGDIVTILAIRHQKEVGK
jgi:plasmid stabilization system protein ParE